MLPPDVVPALCHEFHLASIGHRGQTEEVIIDATSINTGEVIDADLCVVGAGPAGLTLARQFIGTDHRVYLLEAGGERVDSAARELADGEVVGHPYTPLSEARGMAVGGSSHLWEEWLRARPLDQADFERRSWVEGSGWPFGAEELEPYYVEANGLLGLGPYDYGKHRGPLDDHVVGLEQVEFRYSNTFDFEKMRREIEASANVCLVIRAKAIELMTEKDGPRLSHVVASSAPGHRFSVSSRVFTLAAGGIDTPRLMLASRSSSSRGVANSSGLVGAYFMEHPTMRSGLVVPNRHEDQIWKAFELQRGEQFASRLAIVPSEAAMERHGILNGMALVTPSDDVAGSDLLRSLAVVRDALGRRNTSGESALGHLANVVRRSPHLPKVVGAGRFYRPKPRFRLSITVEQEPRRQSRVILSDQVDRFGIPRAAIDWRPGQLERKTVRTLQGLIDRALDDRGLGRVVSMLGEEFPPRAFRGEWHQLGTTRMASSAGAGVVDEHGRTHDLDNLYIAGGSVFPTVGYANPTLTIVALALRLAARLDTVLSRQASLGPIW